MKRSPFPGMDPWLERSWRDVHSRLVIYIADQIQPQLPGPLLARAEESVLLDIGGMPDAGEEPPKQLRPDVAVRDFSGEEEGGVATLAPAQVEVADPLLIFVPESEIDRHVEIIDPAAGGRIVTVIEVLSPSNKMPGPARNAYRAKQQAFVSAGVNLVEIDLVRAGDWVFSIDENAILSEHRTPYMVCVFRETRPTERALYRIGLRESLPRVAIPLRPQDHDVALDLQQALDEAYEKGRYDRTDYRTGLHPPLPPDAEAWARDVLKSAGRL